MKETIFNFKIEKRPHLRKVVYERLKDAILTGAIPHGTKINESKIAEELGISRTPVREALHALEREFLLTAVDKVGYEIRDTDLDDLEEISELRRTVETLALKKAVARMGEDEVNALEENLEKAEKAVAEHQLELFVELDAEFHRILSSLSHRERLARMADGLRKEMTGFVNRTTSNYSLAVTSLDFHRRIVEFLKAKDYRNAKKALNDHISDVSKEQRRALVESQ